MEMNRARSGDGGASGSCYFCRVVSLRRWYLNRDSKAGERAGAVGGVAGRAAVGEHGEGLEEGGLTGRWARSSSSLAGYGARESSGLVTDRGDRK